MDPHKEERAVTDILELGLDTFGDVTSGEIGTAKTHAQVIRDVIDEAVLADELGVDFIGLGEHHRADFAILRRRSYLPRSRDEPNVSDWARL